LDYPVAFFYRETQLYGPGVSEMFNRSSSKIPVKARDKNQACSEIHRINIERLLIGIDMGDIEIPQYDIYEFDGNIQNIARAVRAKWKLPHGPINNVVRTIEAARGIVVPINFESRLVDATSIWPRKMPPIFFMGTNFPTDRIRFSLSHELGHIIMHQDSPNPYQEHQADEFAAEFLMPENDIKPYLTDIDLPKLATLKPYWKVSMAALLKRAKDLGTVTERHAKTLWIEMGKAGYRVREPIETDLPKENPKLLEEIIGVYCNQMNYSVEELANLFALYPHEVCHVYFGAPLSSRQEEVDSAIKEAEKILKEYRR
jgi:Zn-dependent peptidase ImmA (M78 family)